jgi:SAM-dependent MidA family methyltransferase
LPQDGGAPAFREIEHVPAAPDLIPPELQALNPSDFPDGYITETCPSLKSRVHHAVQSIARGAIYFADYGFPAEELRAPHRAAGSLRGYRAHRREDDPYAAPGEIDLTTHVDWTAVQQAIEETGAAVRELTDQGSFLTRLAAPALLRMEGSPASTAAAKWLRQFRTLVHPAHLGRVFQILAAVKNG